MTDAPVELLVHCAHCCEPLTLTMIPASSTISGQTWKCPVCQAQHHGEFPGKLMFVAKGHPRRGPSEHG